MVAGAFIQYGNRNSSYLVRLNIDGAIDSTFMSVSGANNGVEYISISPQDGDILISGNFTSFNGTSRNRIARIFGDPVPVANSEFNVITGKIFRNLDNNCIQNPNEELFMNRVVKTLPSTYWGNTLNNGQYSIQTDSGAYEVVQVKSPLETIFESQYCPPNNQGREVSFGSSLNDTISGIDFVNNVQNCALLSVQVSANRRRRCFRNSTVLLVQNSGNTAAQGITAHLKFPRYLNFISSSIPHTWNPVDSTYQFTFDTLNQGAQRTIYLIDSVSCVPGIMNMELCTKAWIIPGNLCQPNNSNWDEVDLDVTASCENDVPEFTITNSGAAMTTARTFQVYFDTLLALQQDILLGRDQLFRFSIPDPEPGATYRVEVPQSDFHPYETFAAAAVNCLMQTTPGQSGFANPDESPFIATHCSPVLDSYDPNDKAVFPQGTMPGGKVLPNRMFEYRIRFQNTGNDTAYKVVIIDTLNMNLDMATFLPGASSHRYELQVSGKGKPVLTWTYNNIMLPDSFTNSLGSNGFVDFSIRPYRTTPLGTKIENLADIYFDFNEAIRTNTTVNTLYIPTRVPGLIDSINVITSSKLKQAKLVASVFPNPTKGLFHVNSNEPVHVAIMNLAGQTILNLPEYKKQHLISSKSLEKGVYLLVLTSSNGKTVRKLMVE